MVPSLSNPGIISFFGNVSVGALYARCLTSVFVILVLLVVVSQLLRMARELKLLQEAARIRDLQASAMSDATQLEQGSAWPASGVAGASRR